MDAEKIRTTPNFALELVPQRLTIAFFQSENRMFQNSILVKIVELLFFFDLKSVHLATAKIEL